MSTIAPGNKITVKITKEPTTLAGKKTLVRILSRDASVKKTNKRLYNTRKANERITVRGGRLRLWEGRIVTQHPVKGVFGETGTFTATLDVLKDLASVARFVEVKAA